MAGLHRFWLHAPFAELCPCAIDPLVRQVTARRYRQAIALARDLGVRQLVIHGGFVPQVYFPEWYVEQSVLFWRELLAELPPDMTIALENVMEPEPRLLADIARQVDDPRLGLCLRQPGAASGMGGPHGPVAASRPPAQQRRAQ